MSNDTNKGIRVREKDLNEAIHPITSSLKDKSALVQTKDNYDGFDETDDIIIYGFKGTQDYISPNGYPVLYDSNKNVDLGCARQTNITRSDGDTKYLFEIKTCRGTLYNPNELVGNPRNMVSGISQYKWIKVLPKVFHLYINFLRTSNESYLNQARREI